MVAPSSYLVLLVKRGKGGSGNRMENKAYVKVIGRRRVETGEVGVSE